LGDPEKAGFDFFRDDEIARYSRSLKTFPVGKIRVSAKIIL
jgi:hypothetical protein